ncbi:hypothetical protein GGS24DRAFT_493269 [Hypoxylon argillaceum]|nr:hypothetical protein GGS24DRAFT_493269 [Hypoxylon argillaceum]
MTSIYQEYSLVGGNVVPVAVQCVCSYTVYTSRNQEFVVQFRLKSFALDLETVSFHGQLGGEADANGKEPLCIYVMTRIPGISYLNFVLSHDIPDNSPEWFTWRDSLLADMARLVLCYIMETPANCVPRRPPIKMRERTEIIALPARFRPFIEWSLDSIPAIFSLPMVLLHRDFGDCNIIVDNVSCRLIGVVGWAEAEIGSFGLNLHSIETPFTSKFHLKNGWTRYDNYHILQGIFWSGFRREVGGLSADTIQVIHSVMVMRLLLSAGFTSRLANMPEPKPIQDNESGAYSLLDLDRLLLNHATRVVHLA